LGSSLPANELEDSSLPANELEDFSLIAEEMDGISRVIDDYFVTFVQEDDVLKSALGDYLPDKNVSPGREWEQFLKIKLESMNACERRRFRQKYVGPRDALGNVSRRFRTVVKMFIFAIEWLVPKRVEVPEGAGLHADANEETDGKKIEIFYATDRDQEGGEYIGQPCKRAHRLYYGRVLVSIPKGHIPGISETPWKAEAEPNKHVMDRGKKTFQNEQEFKEEIKKSMQVMDRGKKPFRNEQEFKEEIKKSMQVITPPQIVFLQTTLLFRTVGLRNT